MFSGVAGEEERAAGNEGDPEVKRNPGENSQSRCHKGQRTARGWVSVWTDLVFYLQIKVIGEEIRMQETHPREDRRGRMNGDDKTDIKWEEGLDDCHGSAQNELC